MLVDDKRDNFQSTAYHKLLRYCKVARYDAEYYDFGEIKNMGGIGAHDDLDYAALVEFTNAPWTFNNRHRLMCFQEPFPDEELHRAVKLVIFDFHETLTMTTFV